MDILKINDSLRRFLHACVVVDILKIKLLYLGGADFVAWHYKKNGTFSVRSAYQLAMRRTHGEAEIGCSSTPLMAGRFGRRCGLHMCLKKLKFLHGRWLIMASLHKQISAIVISLQWSPSSYVAPE